jgi:hypothetical protein
MFLFCVVAYSLFQSMAFACSQECAIVVISSTGYSVILFMRGRVFTTTSEGRQYHVVDLTTMHSSRSPLDFMNFHSWHLEASIPLKVFCNTLLSPTFFVGLLMRASRPEAAWPTLTLPISLHHEMVWTSSHLFVLKI